jgi:hypothetical protein
MSVPDPTPPEDRLRRIEQETEELAEHMDEAREAVRKAGDADSMDSSTGTGGSGQGVVGGRADENDPDRAGEQDGGGDEAKREDGDEEGR